jgi:hypothetical protein
MGVPQSSSLEVLPSGQISGPFCRALCSSPHKQQEDGIEKRLELAATCIQEALSLHRRNITGLLNDKKLSSSLSNFKVPNVPGSKIKRNIAPSQGESPNNVTGKSIKPRTLTPHPVKKTKPLFADRTSTTPGPATASRGRMNSAPGRRRTVLLS